MSFARSIDLSLKIAHSTASHTITSNLTMYMHFRILSLLMVIVSNS